MLDAQLQDQEYVLYEPKVTYLTTRGEFLSAVEQVAQHLVHSTGRAWMLDGYRSDRVYLRLPCEGLGLPAEAIEVEYILSVQPGQVTFGVPASTTDDTDLIHVFNLFHLFNLLTQQLDLLLLRRAG